MSGPSRPFKALSVIIALSVLGLALLVTSAQALFGTKVAPLFGMSADALANNAEAAPRKATDGGNNSLPDGGARRPRASLLGASKSGLPFHASDFESEPAAGQALADSETDGGPRPQLAPLGASKAFGPFQARDFERRQLGLGGDGGTGAGLGGSGRPPDAGPR